MSIDLVLGAVAGLALLAYLAVAMVFPERF